MRIILLILTCLYFASCAKDKNTLIQSQSDAVTAVTTPVVSSTVISYNLPAPKTAVNHILTLSGSSTNINVDANAVASKACRDNMGVANFTLTGSNSSTGFWFDQTGSNYVWTTALENQMKALNIPLSRSYNVYFEAGAEFHGLDMLATMCTRNNIPLNKIIVCLEPAVAGSKTVVSAATYARAVQYSKAKGYNFQYWETGNEPQYAWGSGLEFPLVYAAHVVAVYNAMKAVDANISVGCQICRKSWYSDQVLSNISGKADFIAAHWYGGQTNMDNYSTSEMILADNFKCLDYIAYENSNILARCGKAIPQIDTEWRLLAAGTENGKMTTGENGNKNGNIVGTCYEAVRMLYNIRDNYTQGACTWHSMGSQPGTLIPSGYYSKGDGTYPLADGNTSYMYWLYYYMGLNTGTNVISFSGNAPRFTGNAIHNVDDGSTGNVSYTGPLTPLMVTKSSDGSKLYMLVVNGSTSVTVPFTATLTNFIPTSQTAVRISDSDISKAWIQPNKNAFVSTPSVTYASKVASISLPPLSITFITLSK